MPTAPPVTGRAAALKSSTRSPGGSTPGNSTAVFHGRFRGSSSTRSGDTAPSKVSTSATAIRSMIENAATIKSARYTVYAIEEAYLCLVNQRNYKTCIDFFALDEKYKAL